QPKSAKGSSGILPRRLSLQCGASVVTAEDAAPNRTKDPNNVTEKTVTEQPDQHPAWAAVRHRTAGRRRHYMRQLPRPRSSPPPEDHDHARMDRAKLRGREGHCSCALRKTG